MGRGLRRLQLRAPSSFTSMESPACAQGDMLRVKGGSESSFEQSFSPLWIRGGRSLCVGGGSAVFLDTGAAANLARFGRLENHNLPLGKHGLPRISACPVCARATFGDGRFSGVRCGKDFTAGAAGRGGALTALKLGVDTPASLRKGALETFGGRFDFPRSRCVFGESDGPLYRQRRGPR